VSGAQGEPRRHLLLARGGLAEEKHRNVAARDGEQQPGGPQQDEERRSRRLRLLTLPRREAHTELRGILVATNESLGLELRLSQRDARLQARDHAELIVVRALIGWECASGDPDGGRLTTSSEIHSRWQDADNRVGRVIELYRRADEPAVAAES
jgi:hypothetical protein